MAKASQPHSGSCLSEDFSVVVFRDLVLSRFTVTLCMTRGAGTQCWLFFQFHDIRLKIPHSKKKARHHKASKHRDHHLGQILKTISGTTKKPKQFQCCQRFPFSDPRQHPGRHLKTSQLCCSIFPASFKDALIGIPVRKFVCENPFIGAPECISALPKEE